MIPLILDQRINDKSNLLDVLNEIPIDFINTVKKVRYGNIAISFDIETTSFYEKDEKRAIMYLWSFCINGKCFIGRDWNSALELFNTISNYYDLDDNKRIIIYIHNLSFEFQFMRKLFTWKSVFSIDDRTPAKALTDNGIEFRCSYILSGYSLAKLSGQLTKYKVAKMVGDLDYSKLRNSKTKLTDKEVNYSINDVLVVVAYIQEKIEQVGDITRLPLTKTGFVREMCRKKCLYDGDNKYKDKYRAYRNKYILSNKLDEEKYIQLKRAFMGGFTHSNAIHTGVVLNNVGSFDLTSAYPARMCSEKFPMGTSETIQIKTLTDFENKLNAYACIFEAEFFDIEATVMYENYISKSHCYNLEDYIENNGRIVEAKRLCVTITEVDFKIIYKLYKWNDLKIHNFRIYKKDYLPRDLVLAILSSYSIKTKLKGVIGKEVEYLKSKEDINSMFGMAVTDIVQDLVTYKDDLWGKEKPDIQETIDKYNSSRKRFLCYEWGIYTTAYNRAILFRAINEFKDDYIYGDTDSIKSINYNNHTEFINNENDRIVDKLKKAMDYQKIPFELTCPKTIKGVKKQLGVWDFEGVYEQFKTLGAKRYMIKEDNALLVKINKNTNLTNKKIVEIDNEKYISYDYNLTVSGVNKAYAIPYICDNYDSPFEAFTENLYIPPQYSGKLTHTYVDNPIEGELTDYQGNTAHYREESYIHLQPAEYTISISDTYKRYLNKIFNSLIN